VLNDSFLVHDERGARAVAAFLVEDAVVADGLAFEIAEERERDLDVFGEARVGGRTVYTDAQNLSFGSVEFGNIRLIRL
jgi:hypothetical protein